MLNSIIAVASGGAEDGELLNVAGALAARLQAQVRVIPAFPDPAADLIYYGAALGTALPEAALERVTAAEREKQKAIEQKVGAVAAAKNAQFVVDKREFAPAAATTSAVVLADLAMVHGVNARGGLAGLFAETLITAQSPCLLINSANERFDTVAIAWDGSAQAGRAVRAAVPILRLASRVLVFSNIDDAASPAGAASPARLSEYLQRCGVRNVASRELRGEHVAASLLEATRAEACDLLVSGAYGRPRLYEMVLGGTTRALVHTAEAPHLLLAH
ncbi:MAG: universal stress protein [Caulobacterales bacterium]|jgi:nucleotide-binding universal stress UspA family protein|nr:universal stress protein [Caulobacterales bacterium]